MSFRPRNYLWQSATAALLFASLCFGTVWDIDRMIENDAALARRTGSNSAALVQSIASSLQPGDALRLSRRLPLGKVVFRNVASNVELTGGFDGEIHVTGEMRGWRFIHCGHNTLFKATAEANLDGSYFFCSFSGKGFVDHSKSSYTAVGLNIVAPLNSKLSKSNAEPDHDGGTSAKWGPGAYSILEFGNREVWMPKYYAENSISNTPQAYIKNATEGGKWLFAIETQQKADVIALKVEDSERLQLYSGSTEGGNNQDGPVYEMTNCNQVVLGMRRLYSNHRAGSGWLGEPAISLLVQGGNGNIIHNLIDIANPKSNSIVCNDQNVQIWQSFFEDGGMIPSTAFQFAATHRGMINQLTTWTEPVQVDAEVILQQSGTELATQPNTFLPRPPAFDYQSWATAAPKRAALNKAAHAERRYRNAETFGAAFIAAGADPTGNTLSDAAFDKVMRNQRVVELPAGTFRVSKSVLARRMAGSAAHGPTAILGKGRNKTIIVAEGDLPVVLDLTAKGALNRQACITATEPKKDDAIVVEGIAIKGGRVGMAIPANGLTTIVSDFRISGLGKAGVGFGYDAWFAMPAAEGVSCGDDSHCNDAHLFIDGEIVGYDYGVIYPGFADKQGFRNITFREQKVAGISASKSNLFHGWIDGCNFIDINGPGVDLSGGVVQPPAYGSKYYTQWVTMIDRCAFVNCGSENRAALDYGYTDINMFTNSSISGTKQIKYGFLGSLAEMSNVDISVNATKAALALRHPRATIASRTPATIIHTVTCNGKMILVDGFPQGDGGSADDPADDFAYTEHMSQGQSYEGWNHSGSKWWVPGEYAWPFPRLFYNSTINGKTFDYVLTSGAGYAIELTTGTAFDMSGVERVGEFADQNAIIPDKQVGKIAPGEKIFAYGIDGRLIGTYTNHRSLETNLQKTRASGMLILKDNRIRKFAKVR